jgi:CRP-like cAMP-binding protein
MGAKQVKMGSNIVLSGSLRFIGLGELLQLLGGNGSTGTLTLTREEAGDKAHVYIVDGNPVNARAGSSKGLDALNSLFGWMDAAYEFRDEPVTCEHLIKKSRMEIILDALRMVDDGEIQKVGESPESAKGGAGSQEAGSLPVIKGPLVDYIYVVDEEEFSAGREIVYQEKYGNWFWVVLEGRVEVIRLLPEGAAPITQLADGAFIGSIGSFMRKGSLQRSATVVAVTDVQLGVMDYDLLFKEYNDLSPMFQAILASIDGRLRQVTTNCAKALLNGLSPRSEMEGFELFNNPDDESAVHLITNGRALIVRRMNGGYLELCLLEPNDLIGYIPFLNISHEPHSALVYVSPEFECKPIDLMGVRKEYGRMSQTFKNLIKHTTTAISVTTGRLFDAIKSSWGASVEH